MRQLTDMVGDSLASRGSEISLEEVLSNAVYFSIFQKYLNEHKLVDGKLLPFMQVRVRIRVRVKVRVS